MTFLLRYYRTDVKQLSNEAEKDIRSHRKGSHNLFHMSLKLKTRTETSIQHK